MRERNGRGGGREWENGKRERNRQMRNEKKDENMKRGMGGVTGRRGKGKREQDNEANRERMRGEWERKRKTKLLKKGNGRRK